MPCFTNLPKRISVVLHSACASLTTGRLLKKLCLFVLLIGHCLSALAEIKQTPTIAIIIDDMGHSYEQGVELINLPYPLTLAFLPERPFTKRLVEMANFHKKEIMLHAPMQNSMGFDLGYGGLNRNMSEKALKQTLVNSFSKINYMVGINNHMGSTLTTDTAAMKWVMQIVRQYPFYFVDSRTSADSVAAATATAFNIPNLTRDVFLDHQQDRDFIQGQFLKLIDIAKEKGTAIAIGHPHRETVEYLSWALGKLDEKGVAIATVSGLWQIRHPQQDLQKELAKLPSDRASQIRLADYTHR